MGIVFYLILAAIAISGVFAIALIFWDRIRWTRNKNKIVFTDDAIEDEKNVVDDEWYDDVRVLKTTVSHPETRIDPALGDLGFGAVDDWLVETDDVIPIKTTVPKAVVKKTSDVNEIIVLYVMAEPEHHFVGYELVQTLLAIGLRYGEMNIFHYYQQTPQGQGEVLFSLASAVEPGVFDLGNVGAILVPGLSLFMSTQVDNPIKTFDLMLETAQQLADDLNGVVCDAQRIPLTETKITEQRNKIHEKIASNFENSF